MHPVEVIRNLLRLIPDDDNGPVQDALKFLGDYWFVDLDGNFVHLDKLDPNTYQVAELPEFTAVYVGTQHDDGFEVDEGYVLHQPGSVAKPKGYNPDRPGDWVDDKGTLHCDPPLYTQEDWDRWTGGNA